MFHQVFDSSFKNSDDDYAAAITSKTETKLEFLNVQLQYGKTKVTAMIDSRIIRSKMMNSLETKYLKETPTSAWTTAYDDKELKPASSS